MSTDAALPGTRPSGLLGEPETPGRASWTALLALANLGLWMGYFGPLLYSLRDQVRHERIFLGQKAEDGLLVLILIYTAAAVVATVIGGVINIANSAPQGLGPALAAPLVTYLGGYRALYLAVAAVTVLGSVLVWKIRSVP